MTTFASLGLTHHRERSEAIQPCRWVVLIRMTDESGEVDRFASLAMTARAVNAATPC